uniref:Transposase n=1 Tax=Haemonchus contortus TaxID=6289 RepID=A0A7I5EE90_HAECO
MKIRYTDHVTNEEVPRRSGMISPHAVVARRRLRLASHVLPMPQQHIPKMAMYRKAKGAKRGRNRPKKRRRTFDDDFKVMYVFTDEGGGIAQNRQQWQDSIARYAQRHGRN